MRELPATRIRLATAADLPAINDIYNYYVIHCTCTYQEIAEPIEGRRRWFDSHGPGHPITVAERDGKVIGWGALSPFHPRAAYRWTVEDSVYVHPDFHRQGLGRLILADLVGRAESLGHHAIVALISADQSPSVSLHERMGFVRVGALQEVGFKFGRWLDVIYMQRLMAIRPPETP